jgi:hypothetical protein
MTSKRNSFIKLDKFFYSTILHLTDAEQYTETINKRCHCPKDLSRASLSFHPNIIFLPPDNHLLLLEEIFNKDNHLIYIFFRVLNLDLTIP